MVHDRFFAGRLPPLTVMHVRLRRGLGSDHARFGAAVGEKVENDLEFVLLAKVEERPDVGVEVALLFPPEQIMHEDPHRVEPGLRGQGQFRVDDFWVEREFLPHFDLVFGIRRHVVAPDDPGLGLSPRLGLFDGPAAVRLESVGRDFSGSVFRAYDVREGNGCRSGERETKNFASIHGWDLS